MAVLLAAALLAVLSAATAQQAGWDLRVCVSAHEPPASDRAHPGYEEKLAGILADEMHANLDLVYTPAGGNGYAVQHELAPGACDMVMGAPEGAQGLVNTVPYLRIPYVFVYRSDASFSVKGLDDPVLKTLKVGVPPNSLMASALQDAGFASSIVPISPDLTVDGGPSMAPLIAKLEDGTVDAVMLYGAYATYFVQQPSRHLQMHAVTPEITPAGYAMFHLETVGVRPGDDSLQRDVNNALAAGWSRIQTALSDAGIPTLSVTQPVASPPPQPQPLVVGVVLPIPTSLPAITDAGAAGAQAGGSLADSLVGRTFASSGRDLRVRFASSPTATAAAVAARRLVLVDHVSALIGGMGDGQAAALARVASQLGVPFLNVADSSAELRGQCSAFVFHVAPSNSMYLDALARWSVATHRSRWYVVALGSDEAATVAAAQRALSKAGGGTVVGHLGVAPDATIFYDAIGAIEKSSPDLVVTVLDPRQQGLFLSQIPHQDKGLAVTGLLPTYAQDRYVFQQLAQDNPTLGSDYRPVMWDPALDTKAAAGLNQAFAAQAGVAMDAGAWSTYMAIKIVAGASASTGSIDPATIAAYLADPDHTFDLAKEVPLSFRPWDHQLRQPLYIAKLDPSASWGPEPDAQRAMASVAATVPSGLGQAGDVNAQLDTLGVRGAATTCQ